MANEQSFIDRVGSSPRLGYRWARSKYTQVQGTINRSSIGAFSRTRTGKAFTQAMGETFGIDYEGGTLSGQGKSMGFMGRLRPGGIFKNFTDVTGKITPIRGLFGLAGRAFMPAFTAFAAYEGYKQGGVWGATKAVGEQALVWGALRMAGANILNPYVLGAAAIGGAAYGGYKFGVAARKHRQRLRGLEMGADIVDTYGTMSTMRQRSLAAIQNTHINGRLSLGNEALLLSETYRR